MRNHHPWTPRVLFLAFAVSLVVYAGVAFAAEPAEPRGASEAVELVRGSTVAHLRREPRGVIPDAVRYTDTDTGDIYDEDESKGLPVAFLSGALEKPRHRAATPRTAEILNAADSLVERCFAGEGVERNRLRRTVTLSGVEPSAKDALKPVEGYTDVNLEYRLIENGIEMPTAMYATFDGGTGELLSFVQFAREPKISLSPDIIREDAIALAAERLGMPIYKVKSVTLRLEAPVEDRQRLGWVVTLSTGDGGVTSGTTESVMIDAHDGTTVWSQN